MLRYCSREEKYKRPFGAVAVGTAIAFLAETSAENRRCRLFLRRESCCEGESDEEWTVEGKDGGMAALDGCVTSDGGEMLRSWHFSYCPLKEGLYFYYFETEQETGSEYQLTVYAADFKTPDWMKKGLMYQVFPDRFCRCSDYEIPPITNKEYRLHQRWGELPCAGADENGVVWNNDFFGGNLRGIQEKLPYLQELGVTVLYLNPIFEAFSNHRYDTANYRVIDPMLGTEEDLRRLCKEAKERGIRILLDGVFNHTGSHSIYFNQDGAYESCGACQGDQSPYYGWYRFYRFPDDYECWWGMKNLPEVNETEDSYLDYILRDEDSVVNHWMKCGISGYRLDVADELPDVFLDELRRQVKGIDEDACILGEVWEDASNKIAYDRRRRYFQGKQLDSVMNYPLKDELIAFFLKHGDGRKFMERIESLWENYPPQAFYALMNLLGTHDTVRIYTVMLNGSGKDRQLGRQRLLAALLIWMFMPGIPCIYYGDELGMEGERDPMNRQCFPKEAKDEEVARFYRRLLSFYRRVMEEEVMEFCPGDCGEGYVSFFRLGEKSRIFVWINASSQPVHLRFPLDGGKGPLDLLNCGHMELDEDFGGCTLGGVSGVVVQLQR